MRKLTLAIIAAAALALAAPTALAAGTFQTQVELHEIPPGGGFYHLAPDEIVFDMARYDKLVVTVVNPPTNTEDHNLRFCGDAGCKTSWGFVPNIAPGANATVELVPDKATTADGFPYYCTIEGHKDIGPTPDGGMLGSLIVRAPPAEEKRTPFPAVAIVALAAIAIALGRR